MPVTATNSKIVAFNTMKAITSNAATSTVIDETEVVTVTPTSADYKTVLRFEIAAGQGEVTASIPAGDQYGAESALTLTIPEGASFVEIEAGKYMTDGAYAITLTPASGKRLATDHAATVEVLESL